MRFHLFIAVLLIAADQGIKALVRTYLTPASYIEIIPNFIHLTYQENTGISFSLLSELPTSVRVPLLAGVSLVVIIVLLIYVYRGWSGFNLGERWGFTLILSGAAGNLIDRAFRKQVTDYMFFHLFDISLFVNNLADDLISIGFVLIVWASLRKKEPEK